MLLGVELMFVLTEWIMFSCDVLVTSVYYHSCFDFWAVWTAVISGLFGDLKWGSGVLWLLLAREAWNLASQLSIRLVSVCIPLSCFVSPLHTL